MGKNKIKLSAIMLVVILSISVLSGCSIGGKQDAMKDNEKKTLTFWGELPPNASATVTNLGETPFAQELEKRTGIKVEYIHPAQGQAKEQFNLMVASRSFPDMVYYNWMTYSGGPTRAIQNGDIIDLKTSIQKNAPNLKVYLENNPEVDKMIKTDKGNYYVFPFIREADHKTNTSGFIIRKDWLDELEFKIPETIDEWEIVLEAFKDKGAEAPLILNEWHVRAAILIGAYGIGDGFYLENGKVKYGPIEPAFKDYIITMKRWYDKGLIDKNFPTVNNQVVDASILNGRSGATYGALGGQLGKYILSMKEKDPKFDLIGTSYPVAKKGDKRHVSVGSDLFNGLGVAITKDCSNIQLAAKWLDYGYSEDGHMLYNFGIEGVSYTMVDGYPKYTDIIMNNPDKLSVNYAMARYFRTSSGGGATIQDKIYLEQYYNLEQQKKSAEIFTKSDGDIKNNLPTIISLTDEESREYNRIMQDAGVYKNEMIIKFITGIESIENYDKYIETMKNFELERATKLQQQAYDRYINR